MDATCLVVAATERKTKSSGISLGGFFGVAKEDADNCKKTALTALLDCLESRTYFWPDASERQVIASRIKEAHLFPNCVGLIDGTSLPLKSRPILHGENYLSRKKRYAIVMLVACDDLGRILCQHTGWPGSVHDNRVWRSCKLNRCPNRYFSPKQYLLGDSAFNASDIMIPPFKVYGNQVLTGNKTTFNMLLAKPRVKSEHCIGILKGRLPMLRNIPMKLGSKEDMLRIVDYVRRAVVLHNFLIADPIGESWIEREEQDGLEPEETTINSSLLL